MNKSYSKLRHIDNVNYLIEQKYVSEKRKSDLGILSEQSDRNSKADQIKQYCKKFSGGKISRPSLIVFKRATQGMGYMTQQTLDQVIETINDLSGPDLCATMNGYGTGGDGRDMIASFLNYLYSSTAENQVLDAMNNKLKSTIKSAEDAKNKVLDQTLQIGTSVIKNYCKTSKGGTVNDGAYEVFKFATQGRGYMSETTWQNVLSKIKSLSINNFCAIYVKYQTEIGKDLIDQLLAYILSPAAKQEIINLINTRFGGEQSPAEQTNGQDSSTTPVTGGDFGTAYPNTFTPNVLLTIRAKTNSGESAQTLTQKDVNSLYDLISKLP
jgi:hypothetical protein